MYSSYSLSKRFVSVPFLVVVAAQLLFIGNVSCLNLTNAYLHHKCMVSEGKYEAGSTFEKNLNSLNRLVSTTNFRYGFIHMANEYGTPNSLSIIYQCRGDSYWSKCRSCYATAISGLRRRCPRNKGSIIWYDQCFVEITSVDSIDNFEPDYKNNFYVHNPNKVSGDANLFNKETVALLENLTLKATSKDNIDDGRMALYAAGEKRIGTKTTLYAIVQCTREIYMDKMCKECLDRIIKEFPKCCDGKQGGRVLGTSCNFRYELYPFLRT